MKTNVTRNKTVRVRTEMSLDGDSLIELLNIAHLDIPKDAKVSFMVPGGGDWSNTSIDIDHENMIYIEFETIEQSEE